VEMTRLRKRLGAEDGTALIIALMATMLLTALGAAVIMVTTTETKISNNYSNAQEALYAADAAVERVVQDLLMVPRWNDILTGATQSAFVDGSMTGMKQLVGGGSTTLCCGTSSATGQLQAETDLLNSWGANNPQWRLFAYGPMSEMLGSVPLESQTYIAVWVADDPAEIDNDPAADVNGVVTVLAQAFGPHGTHRAVEVTLAKTDSREIERGQIAQRGQEELNQRARKAAVQMPGTAMSASDLNVNTGGLLSR